MTPRAVATDSSDDRAPGRPIGLAPGAPEEAAGQDAKKYATTNPVVQRLLARWMGRLHRRDRHGRRHGGRRRRRRGTRARTDAPGRQRADRRRVPVRQGRGRPPALPGLAGVRADAGMLPLADGCADLVTCIELLEHLPGVRAGGRRAGPHHPRPCVVSVPWEPWFRLGNLGRGKNVRPLRQRPRARPVLHAPAAEAPARALGSTRSRSCRPSPGSSPRPPRPSGRRSTPGTLRFGSILGDWGDRRSTQNAGIG